MKKQFNVSKDNSSDLGFAEGCLIMNIISLDEFKEWLYLVIERNEDIPTYIFDLLDFKDRLELIGESMEVIGYVPSSAVTSAEMNAMDGIGFLRFSNYHSDSYTKEQAIALLKKQPQLIERFKKTFPFIKLADIESL